MSKIHVFSHLDLDGVVSYLVLKWYFKKSIPVIFTTANRFREDFEQFIESGQFGKADRVFILDLDVSAHADIVDHEKVYIYDHHSTNDATYTSAKGGVKPCSSTAKLLYSAFSKLPGAEYSAKQKRLILYADDYDSYTLAYPESMQLNTLLFESQNKPWNFIKEFEIGFDQFNDLQQNIIFLHNRKRDRIISGLGSIYKGTVKLQNKERLVCACFAEACINEVADYLCKEQNAEVAIVVNSKSGHISFRRNATSDCDVSKIAEVLCSGGGREDTAGGELTEKFQDFAKLLKQVKIG